MLLEDLFNLLDEINRILSQAEFTMDSIMQVLLELAMLWEAIIVAVGIIGAVISSVISFVIGFFNYLVKAIPVYKLAKKKGRKKAWLAWVPVWSKYFRWYVMMDMPGNKPFEIFKGKISVQDRQIAYWVRVLIIVFGTKLVGAIGVVLGFIPYIGTLFGAISGILYLALEVICGMIRFVFLRDVLDLYSANKKQNRIAAIVIAVLDSLATLGFAETIWLYLIIKKDPLPEEPVVVEAIPEAAT